MVNKSVLQPLFDSFSGVWGDTASKLTGMAVVSGAPEINVLGRQDVLKSFSRRGVLAVTVIARPCPGISMMLFPLPAGSLIPERIMNPAANSAPAELTDLHLSAMQELCAQTWVAASRNFGNVLGRRFSAGDTSVSAESPAEFILKTPALVGIDTFVVLEYPVRVESAEARITQIFPAPFIVDAIPESSIRLAPDRKSSSAGAAKNAPGQMEALEAPHIDPKRLKPRKISEEKVEKRTSRPAGARRNLDVLMDIPVELIVELGAANVPAERILNISQGSVVELDSFANKPVRIFANGHLIARGTVVTANDKFGVMISELVEPEKRLVES